MATIFGIPVEWIPLMMFGGSVLIFLFALSRTQWFNNFLYESLMGQTRFGARMCDRIGADLQIDRLKFIAIKDGHDKFEYGKSEYYYPKDTPAYNEEKDGKRIEHSEYKPEYVVDNYGHKIYTFEKGMMHALTSYGVGNVDVPAAKIKAYKGALSEAVKMGMTRGNKIMTIVLVIGIAAAAFGCAYFYSNWQVDQTTISFINKDLSTANLKVYAYEKWFADNHISIPTLPTNGTGGDGGIIVG